MTENSSINNKGYHDRFIMNSQFLKITKFGRYHIENLSIQSLT